MWNRFSLFGEHIIAEKFRKSTGKKYNHLLFFLSLTTKIGFAMSSDNIVTSNVVVIRAPLQRLCYTVMGAVD